MSRKPNPYNKILVLLQELHQQYPNYSMGRHISTALSDYGDIWGLPDKELLFAFEKYKAELEINTAPDADVDFIIKDASKLTPENYKTFLDEEEEEDFI